MADAVKSVIYKYGVDNAQYLAAAQQQAQANERLVASTAKVTASEERLTAANRGTADAFSKLEGRYDKIISLEQRRTAALQQARRIAEEAGVSEGRLSAQLDRVNRSYDQQTQRARAAAAANENFARAAGAANDNTSRFGTTIDRVRGALGAFGIVLGAHSFLRFAKDIIAAADAWTAMANQLRVVTGSAEAASAAQERLVQIALASRADLGSVVTLFQRLSIAAGELGVSQDRLFTFTERVGKSLALMGITAEQARGPLLQLGQSLQSGIVRAEEFNSQLEGAYPLVQAAARGIERMGGSVAKLRQEVVAGTVTSKEYFEGIERGLENVDQAFANMSLTIGQAMTNLETRFVAMIGNLNDMSDATTLVAEGIDIFSRSLSFLPDILALTAAGVTATLAPLLLMREVLRELGVLETPEQRRRAQEAGTAEHNAAQMLTESLKPAAITPQADPADVRAVYDIIEGLVAKRTLDPRDLAIRGALERAEKALAKIPEGAVVKETLTEELRIQAGLLYDAEQATKGFAAATRDAEKAQREAAKAAAERSAELEEEMQREQEARDSLETMIVSLRDEREHLGESDEARYVRLKLLEAEKVATEGAVGNIDDYLDRLEQEAVLTFRAGEAHKKKLEQEKELAKERERLAEQEAEALAAPFKHAGEEIQDLFSDVFASIFNDGTFSFSRLADIAKQFAAEVASAWIFEPLIKPVIDAFSPSGRGVPGASLAGGGASFSPMDFLSGKSSITDLLLGGGGAAGSSSTGGLFDGLGGLFDKVGDIFSSSFASGIFGPPAGDLRFRGGAGSDANNFAGGGLSFGSLLGDSALLGLGGFGLTLASGGSFGDAALTGGGAALGNLVLPGIGGAIGGLLGSLFGGLFGGSPPKPAANQFFTLGPGGSSPFSGGSASFPGDLQGTVTQAGENWASGFAALLDQLGASLLDEIVAGLRLGPRGYGYKIVDPDVGVVKDSSRAGDDGALDTAINNLSFDVLRYTNQAGKLDAPDLVKTLIGNTGSLSELSELYEIAKIVFPDDLASNTGQFAAAMRTLNDAFDAAAENAEKFGKTVAEVEAARVERLAELRDEFDRGLTGEGDFAGAMADILDGIKSLIADAKALATSPEQLTGWLDQIAALGEDQLRDAFLQTTRGQIGQFGKDLRFSDLSPYGLEQQYREARGTFLDTRSGALAGDPGDLARFQSDASLFLQLSRAFQGSGANYAPDFELVAGASEQIASIGEQQLSVQQQMLASLIEIARNTATATPSTPPTTPAPTPSGPNPAPAASTALRRFARQRSDGTLAYYWA